MLTLPQTFAALLIAPLVLATGCVPRSERDVVVYSALDESFADPILRGFERRVDFETGVVSKFDVESNKTIGLVNQIIAESDSPRGDVFWNNEILHTVRLQKLGLLAAHDWNVPAGYPDELIASDGTWYGFAARARVLIVNTESLPNTADRPTRVTDLADEKWAGRCAIARPLFGTSATHAAVLRDLLGEDDAFAFYQGVAQNAEIVSGNKQVAMRVAAGDLSWGLTDTDDAIIEVTRGAPVAIVFPDQQPAESGTLRIPNTLCVLKNAPHPVAAGQLVDYLSESETEDRLAMGPSSQIPMHPNSKFPPVVLPTEPVRWMRVDYESAAEGWDRWAGRLTGLFSHE